MKTIDEWRDDADDLIREHNAWKKRAGGDVEKILNKKNGAPATRLELELLAGSAKLFGQRARFMLAQPSASLAKNGEHVEDLTEIAEESEIGAAEAEAAADPDTIYAESDRQTKLAITQKMPIRREKADRIRARLRGDRRGQPSAVVVNNAADKK